MPFDSALLRPDSLRATPSGYELALRLPWMRSLQWSCVTGLTVRIHGVDIDAAALTIEVDGERLPLDALAERWDSFWVVGTPATVAIPYDQPRAAGETVDVEVTLAVLLPYLSLGPGRSVVIPTTASRELVVAADRPSASVTSAAPVAPTSRAAADDPSWAVTTFSFTNEITSGEESPDAVVARVVAEGLAKRVEIDSFQHFASFPHVTADEAARFRDQVDALGVELTELGIYLDTAQRRGRPLGFDESVAYLQDQVESAARLGFPAVKIMFGTDPELQRALLPTLERHGIPLYQEVQGHVGIDSPELERQRDVAARTGAGLLGFVFDLSACMPALPVTYLAELERLTVPRAVIDLLDSGWTDLPLGELRARMDELLVGVSLPPDAHPRLAMPFLRFGRSPVPDFRPFLPEVSIVHLKFWDLEDQDGRVSGPIADVRRELDLIGFAGPVTSEWGGHEWLASPEYTGSQMTRGHRALYDAAAPSR